MQKRINVCHLITGLYTGGAEMMLYKLLSGTVRRRFNPVVVTLMEGGPVWPKIEALGIPVYSIGMRQGVPTPAAAWRLVRLMRRLSPDLIQGWMYHGNLAAQLAAAFLPERAPVIWNIRGSHYNLRKEKFLTAAIIWLEAKLSGRPARIINNSAASAKMHEERLCFRADKTVIIPNGFNTDLFAPSGQARVQIRQELGLTPDALLIGRIGRYHPMKDHANFFRAAALLLRRIPDAHFVLAGRGVDRNNDKMVQQIACQGITGRVHLLGEREDTARLTAALDIAVSSSAHGEGFPNVVGEAMSCGVPCAVTDVGDSAYVVGETGLVAPPGDASALAKALKSLADLGPVGRQTLGAAARERVVGHFSLPAIAARYEALYNEVLGGKTAGKDDFPGCAV